MVKLRAPQEASVEAVRASLRAQIDAGEEQLSTILQSPTGSGKTIMAGAITKSTVEKGGTLAFLVHRRELLDQTALTFDKFDIDYGYIASGYPEYPSPVQLCSVPTLVKRVSKIKAPKVAVVDECHHVGASMWNKILEAWPDTTIIGLSATPCRLDGKSLGDWFNDLVPGPSVKELMAEGFLSTYDAYAPSVPDVSSVHLRGGDYVKGELESVLDTGEILGRIVEHWTLHAKGRRTIGFAVTVEHSKHLAQAFCDAGIKAAHIDAKTPKALRKRMLQQFALGHIQVLWNVDLFGEGYDLAANSGMDVTVDAVILARPTASLALHLQQIGRCLRPKADGRPAVILDHAGNCMRPWLGLPDADRSWDLHVENINDEQKAQPTRACPKCHLLYPSYVKKCSCGYVWPVIAKRKSVEEVDGTLEKIVDGAETAEQLQLALRERRKKVERARTLEALLRIQKQRGLPDGWAERVIKERQRAWGRPTRRL